MAKINGRNKGASGEREFCYWLKENLALNYLPERNLEQVRHGGADIMDVPPYCFEVKRVEVLQLKRWWLQVVKACTIENHIPVVAFRQNRKPWKFLISAKNIGLSSGYIQLEEKEFIEWIIN